MANRPIFLPLKTNTAFVREIPIEFHWFPGMAVSQKQRSIESLHSEARAQRGINKILEISSKSRDQLGVRLSAFNLMLVVGERKISVEVVYQAGKRFERGGPFLNILEMSSRDAKTDPRLRESGSLLGFSFLGESWPLQPTTSFYDWLYLKGLECNPDLSSQLLEFDGFTDIEFNPEKSWNCQARSAALYVSLYRLGMIEKALANRLSYFETIGMGSSESSQAALF